MAITTTCPSCRGPLRVPDELLGQRVRCPVCQNVFEAATDAAGAPPAPESAPPPEQEQERPLWKDLQLELDKTDPAGPQKAPEPEPQSEPEPPPPPPAQKKPGLVGAVELKLSIDDEPAAPAAPPRPSAPSRRPEPPPHAPEPPPSAPRPRDYPPDRFDDEDEDYRGARRPYYRPPRRDTEPHRGGLILTLGIISVVCVVASWCYGVGILIGIPLGITAWVLGQGDLRKIKNQQMDDEGLGLTQAGWICGIIGTILNTLMLLACGGFIAFFFYQMSLVQPPATKSPFVPNATTKGP